MLFNDFIGGFNTGKKDGEGQQFYDGGIYDGSWRNNKRSGKGIMWYYTGALYFGEWENGVYFGSGVLIKGDRIMNFAATK